MPRETRRSYRIVPAEIRAASSDFVLRRQSVSGAGAFALTKGAQITVVVSADESKVTTSETNRSSTDALTLCRAIASCQT